MTNLSDSKMGPKYSVGQKIKIFDVDDEKVINGVITEVGEETIAVQWEDLQDDTEYEISKIKMKGDFLYETQ